VGRGGAARGGRLDLRGGEEAGGRRRGVSEHPMQKRSSRRKNEEEEGLRHGSRARGGHSSGESGRGTTHRWTAKGSSHEPGQDCTTTLDSLTPHSRSLAFAPATRGSMMVEFQRAWTM